MEAERDFRELKDRHFVKKFITSVDIERADFDGYGHLRFSKYPWYFDLAREKFIENNGLGIKDMKERNLGFFVRSGEIKHIRQLRVEGDVNILTWFGNYEGDVFVDIFQRMERGSQSFAVYKTRNVFVNLDTGSHVKPPDDIIKMLFG